MYKTPILGLARWFCDSFLSLKTILLTPSFETSDGTSRQETGTLKQFSEDHKAIQVQGQYKYTAPDGLIYTVTYTADEHGFQPQEHVSHSGDQQQYQQ